MAAAAAAEAARGASARTCFPAAAARWQSGVSRSPQPRTTTASNSSTWSDSSLSKLSDQTATPSAPAVLLAAWLLGSTTAVNWPPRSRTAARAMRVGPSKLPSKARRIMASILELTPGRVRRQPDGRRSEKVDQTGDPADGGIVLVERRGQGAGGEHGHGGQNPSEV